MNIAKKTIIYSILIIAGLLIFSCSKNEEPDTSNFINQTENFINISDIENICSSSEYEIINVGKQKQGVSKKTIENIKEVTDELGNVVFYIINYKNKGFVILSADNRLEPILAYSESNSFSVDFNNLPLGVSMWLEDTKNKVKHIRKLGGSQKPKVKKRWDILLGQIQPLPGDDDGDGGDGDDCIDIHIHVEPLLTTHWHQGGEFNDLAPFENCVTDIDGRTRAGCVAIAMGQVMKYNEFPNNYNWTDMPNDVGTNETAQLLRNIGDAVNMDWGCTASYADENEIASSLEGDFGYNSAIFSSFYRYTIEDELSLNRPVILVGYNYGDEYGHAWVCDGYVRSIYCDSGASYLVLHMNWGWGGDHDGYYNYDNWHPTNTDFTFNDGRKMITNIIP